MLGSELLPQQASPTALGELLPFVNIPVVKVVLINLLSARRGGGEKQMTSECVGQHSYLVQQIFSKIRKENSHGES